MNGMVQNFEKLLDKFRFREPIPPDVSRYILDYKMKSLINTLKAVNEYGIIYGFVLKVYYSAKKIGVRLSVAQSKVVAFTVFLIISASVSLVIYSIFLKTGMKDLPGTGGYESKQDNQVNGKDEPGKSINNKENTIDDKTGEKTNNIEENKDKMLSIKDSEPPVKYRIGVETFTSSAVKTEEAIKISDLLTEELIKIKGNNKVKRLYSDIRKNSNFVLLGSVEMLGKSYIISAKIVNVENSKVTYSVSDNAETKDEINTACLRIAKKIALSIE